MANSTQKWLTGTLGSAAVTVVAPLVGLAWTMIGMNKAYSAVDGHSVEASAKATTLAEGINFAMTSTAIGLGVGLVAAVATVACVVGLVLSIQKANRSTSKMLSPAQD